MYKFVSSLSKAREDLLFIVLLENFSFIWRRHLAVKSVLGTHDHWVMRVVN